MRDPALDRLLAAEGYAVVDLISPELVSELLAFAEPLHPAVSGWESDFYHHDLDARRAVQARLVEAFRQPIDDVLADHRSVLHSFVFNWPGEGGGLQLHQHSSVVDEREHRSVVIWCALTPTTEENGTLHVAPRSHLVQRGPRPERSRSWCEPHVDQILADHLVSVPLAPGQAIVFDNQLLHCSFANTTAAPRVAVALVVIPAATAPLFYEAVGEHTVDVYDLDTELFLSMPPGQFEWPDPSEVLHKRGVGSWAQVHVASHELGSLLVPGTCSHERA